MVDCGVLDVLVICLEEFDFGVKESVVWALGYIVRYNVGEFMIMLIRLLYVKKLYINVYLRLRYLVLILLYED